MRILPILMSLAFLSTGCSDDTEKEYPSRNKPPQSSNGYAPSETTPPSQSGPAPVPMPTVPSEGDGIPQPGITPQPGQYQDMQPNPGYPSDPIANPGYPTNPVPNPANPVPPQGPGSSSPNFAGPAPVFVVMGGYKSCKAELRMVSPQDDNIYAAFARMSLELHQHWGFKPEFIFSCYFTNAPDILVTSSRNPGQLDRVPETELAPYIAQRVGGSPVVFIGHSLGGWLAMKTSIALLPQIRIGMLVTLDPISATECKIPFTKPCWRAPRDFGVEEIATLSRASGKWMNYFQRESLHLRSSEIPAAHVNTRLKTEHGAVDTSPIVWKDITAHLAGFKVRSIGQ